MENNDFVLLGGGFILGILGYQLIKRNPDFLKNIQPQPCPQGTGLVDGKCVSSTPPPSGSTEGITTIGGGSVIPETQPTAQTSPLDSIVSMLDTKFGYDDTHSSYVMQVSNGDENFINTWNSAIKNGDSTFTIGNFTYSADTGSKINQFVYYKVNVPVIGSVLNIQKDITIPDIYIPSNWGGYVQNGSRVLVRSTPLSNNFFEYSKDGISVDGYLDKQYLIADDTI